MHEVEAKVPISKKDYPELKRTLAKMATPQGERISADTYYEKTPPVHIRVRQNGNQYIFTVKRRQTVRGIESNLEMEWGIKSIAPWRSLLKKLKMKPLVRKYKKSLIFRWKGFSIELNHVRKLGYYLEIEKTVALKSEIPKAKNDLIALYRQLGYSAKQFEPRPYLQLLENV